MVGQERSLLRASGGTAPCRPRWSGWARMRALKGRPGMARSKLASVRTIRAVATFCACAALAIACSGTPGDEASPRAGANEGSAAGEPFVRLAGHVAPWVPRAQDLG